MLGVSRHGSFEHLQDGSCDELGRSLVNNCHMSVQMALLLERGRTLSALIRTFVSVLHTRVLRQAVAKRECGITLVAKEVPFSAVNTPNVLVEVSSLQWQYTQQ